MVQFFNPTAELEAKRRRKLADQLMAAGKQSDKTEIVSGYAVPQSPAAALAKALQTGLGGYQEGKAAKLEEEAAKQRAELYQRAISGGDRQKAAEMLSQDPNSQEQALKIAFPTSYLGGATGALADRLIAAGVPELDALMIAKSGAGVGRGYDPTSGQVIPMAGAADAAGAIKYGETTGGNQSDLQYKPQIKQAESFAGAVGQEEGEAAAKLNAMEAQFPRLEDVVNKLSDLGKKATYTYGGQAVDTLKRQTGQPVGEGAVARTEYISTVDNEVLPLLRQTFGAQFTEREGQSLKVTLGDPNKSPEEKDAVLRAFIQQKSEEIETLKRQTGRGVQAPTGPQTPEEEEFLRSLGNAP